MYVNTTLRDKEKHLFNNELALQEMKRHLHTYCIIIAVIFVEFDIIIDSCMSVCFHSIVLTHINKKNLYKT